MVLKDIGIDLILFFLIYSFFLETIILYLLFKNSYNTRLLSLLKSLDKSSDLRINIYISKTTLIISKKPGNTGISRDIRTEFTTDLLLSD